MGSTATRICEAVTKRGVSCQNPTMPDRPFCWWHDPALAEQRLEARSRGGRARHGRKQGVGLQDAMEINNLGDVVTLVTAEINGLREVCEVSISRARAMGYLAGILASIYQASELEARIERLEQARGGRA